MTDKDILISDLNDISEILNNNGYGGWCKAIRKAVALLKEQPEIVRCKDCRYGQYCTDGETMYQCFKWNSGEFGVLHEQDWFCADGERSDT